MCRLPRRCSYLLILLATGNVCLAGGQAEPQRSDAACEACHGAGGNKPISPETPRLAGQESDYLVEALLQYRKGARQNPIMGAMAKSLNDEQIRELAKYFSAQRGLTEKY
jgi:cytochrome c553